MTALEAVHAELRARPRTWAVTGAAGFIGSHLVQELLELGQSVRALDDLSTGHARNLDAALAASAPLAPERYRFVEASLEDSAACSELCSGADVVLHQAALGSVPRSIEAPLASHAANVNGFLTLLDAARTAGVARFVYASSSSVYGDAAGQPKREEVTGAPLSPYAATKLIDELYAGVFQRTYGLETIGLRYFNVFGPRQDPDGPYAAVIPRWIQQLVRGEPVTIFGDGETSRDFCPVANVVAANLLAALAPSSATGAPYNIALGERTTLNELFAAIRAGLVQRGHALESAAPRHADFRAGDVRHSFADLTRARDQLGYRPVVTFAEGLARTLDAMTAGGDAG